TLDPTLRMLQHAAQRQCAACEDEDLMRQASPADTFASDATEQVSDALGSGGQPLDDSARTFMEPRFGYDFSQVRIHTDAKAAESAQSINALAYTVGQDIVFGAGHYAPTTNDGKQLLAHELTHVVQQTQPQPGLAPTLQREADPGTGGTTTSTPPTTATPGSNAASGAAQQLIVEDTAEQLEPGQTRKSEFLAQLRPAVQAAAEEALSVDLSSLLLLPVAHTEIERQFATYSTQDSRSLDQTIRPYAPKATQASDYIPAICQQVRQTIAQRLNQGITGLPDGTTAPGEAPATETDAAEELEPTRILFKAQDGSTAQAPDDIHAVQTQLGSGRALDSTVQARMGTAFGEDFSQVRLHTDTTAAQLSQDMNARAFTLGEHVAFASGEYQPGTLMGDALIAHELAHVVQQKGASSELQQKGADNNSALETDADWSAIGVVSQLWFGATGALSNLARKAGPRLRSGLGLRRCDAGSGSSSGPVPSAPVPSTPVPSGPVPTVPPVAPPAPPAPAPAPAPAGPYTWSNAVLKARVEGRESAANIVVYVNGLATGDRDIAIRDLQNGRIDYIRQQDALRSGTITPAVRRTYRRLGTFVSKVDVILQTVYSQVATTETSATLLAGTHVPTAAEKAEIDQALVPPRGSVAVPDFKSHIPAGSYEDRIRRYLTREIDGMYNNLVRGRGPAEHADPAKVHPMSRFEEIGNTAKTETDAVFGSYATAPTFTAGVNLFDAWEKENTDQAAMTPAQRQDKARELVSYLLQSERGIFDINRAHGAIPSRTTLSPGETEAEATILDRIRNDLTGTPAQVQRLNDIDRGWPGWNQGGNVGMQMFKASTGLGNRRNFWDAFQTMIHEYIHSLAHANYNSHARSFPGGHDSEQYNTLVEGMDSVLTETVWANVSPRVRSAALRQAVEGSTYAAKPFEASTVPPISSRRYPSYDQAMRLINIVGVRNAYAAYFLGRTDLIS
uniref:eCIS core domain-containing protein n=1 Tax=Oculatella sp. LEGE 06141 TaxID=1828648 RepID=UPI00188053FA